jgi:predicted nuclease of predicted toxin-antitoxin system
MKLLLDTCVWAGATKVLAAAGHDVRWIGETDPDPGDEEIIRKAYNEGCVLITLDKDFGELAIVYGKPHRGIVRLVNIPGRQQARYCVKTCWNVSRRSLLVAPYLRSHRIGSGFGPRIERERLTKLSRSKRVMSPATANPGPRSWLHV